MSTIGDNIKRIRKSKKMTQAQLAEKTEISVMSVRRFETGARVPKLDMVDKIAVALDVSPADLLGWDWIDDLQEMRENAPKIINSDEYENFEQFIMSKGYSLSLKDKKLWVYHDIFDDSGNYKKSDKGPALMTEQELDMLVGAFKLTTEGIFNLLDDILDRGNNQAEQAENKGE